MHKNGLKIDFIKSKKKQKKHVFYCEKTQQNVSLKRIRSKQQQQRKWKL